VRPVVAALRVAAQNSFDVSCDTHLIQRGVRRAAKRRTVRAREEPATRDVCDVAAGRTRGCHRFGFAVRHSSRVLHTHRDRRFGFRLILRRPSVPPHSPPRSPRDRPEIAPRSPRDRSSVPSHSPPARQTGQPRGDLGATSGRSRCDLGVSGAPQIVEAPLQLRIEIAAARVAAAAARVAA